MRIDSLLQRRLALLVLTLAGALAGTACNEADGTEQWEGVYPHEVDIDRPKMAIKDAGSAPKDAGADAAAVDGGGADAATSGDAAADAGDVSDAPAGD